MESRVLATLNTSIRQMAGINGGHPRRNETDPPVTYQNRGDRNPSTKFSAKVSTAALLTPS
jgi:hypothetical protein